VLAVACDHRVRFGGATHRADALLTWVPARAWQCISAGKGAKGHRLYDWAFLRLDHDRPALNGQAGTYWLMVRRNRTTSGPDVCGPSTDQARLMGSSATWHTGSSVGPTPPTPNLLIT
jgi:hypothetical protein